MLLADGGGRYLHELAADGVDQLVHAVVRPQVGVCRPLPGDVLALVTSVGAHLRDIGDQGP
eukprot:5860173-Pyramimonas_sp.AAC.1